MGFSRLEYWSGEPFSSSGDLPEPGIKPRSPALRADSSLSEPPGKPKLLVSVGWKNVREASPSLRAQNQVTPVSEADSHYPLGSLS